MSTAVQDTLRSRNQLARSWMAPTIRSRERHQRRAAHRSREQIQLLRTIARTEAALKDFSMLLYMMKTLLYVTMSSVDCGVFKEEEQVRHGRLYNSQESRCSPARSPCLSLSLSLTFSLSLSLSLSCQLSTLSRLVLFGWKHAITYILKILHKRGHRHTSTSIWSCAQ